MSPGRAEPAGQPDTLAELDALLAEARKKNHTYDSSAAVDAILAKAREIVTRMRGAKP